MIVTAPDVNSTPFFADDETELELNDDLCTIDFAQNKDDALQRFEEFLPQDVPKPNLKTPPKLTRRFIFNAPTSENKFNLAPGIPETIPDHTWEILQDSSGEQWKKGP